MSSNEPATLPASTCPECETAILPGATRCPCGWKQRPRSAHAGASVADAPHRWEPEIQARIAANPEWIRSDGESRADYARRMLRTFRTMRDAGASGLERTGEDAATGSRALELEDGGIACVLGRSR